MLPSGLLVPAYQLLLNFESIHWLVGSLRVLQGSVHVHAHTCMCVFMCTRIPPMLTRKTMLPAQQAPGIQLCSTAPDSGMTGVCRHTWLFMSVLRDRTQALNLLCYLGYHPSPRLQFKKKKKGTSDTMKSFFPKRVLASSLQALLFTCLRNLCWSRQHPLFYQDRERWSLGCCYRLKGWLR